MHVYAVRRSSGGLAQGTFTRDKLHDDLDEILFARKGPFDEGTLWAVVDQAILRLEKVIPSLQTRLTEAEFRSRPDIVGAIPDTLISEAVEEVLRRRAGSSFRLAELLYVMAIRGRDDYRKGWSGASDVLNWIRTRYEGVEVQSQKGRFIDQPRLRLPSPHRAEWRPETVLKRDGRVPDFAIRQLQKSIRAALWGRRDANAKALMVAHLVLGEIRGQRIVQSSQISSAVLSGLRRIDDIGYLRWAAIIKNMRSVRQLANEAIDLIDSPSPALQVTNYWRQRARSL
ncbi:MAG: ATP cone domain-containing protein [Rhodoglobus sp.]